MIFHVYDCISVQSFWDDIIQWFGEIEGIKIEKNWKSCVFGIATKKKDIQRWNVVALYARYYIYITSIKELQMNKEAGKMYILARIKIDDTVSRWTYSQVTTDTNDNERKWSKWTTLMLKEDI